MENLMVSIVILFLGMSMYYMLYLIIDHNEKRTAIPDEGIPETIFLALVHGLISTDEAIKQFKSLGISQREAQKAVCLALKERDKKLKKSS